MMLYHGKSYPDDVKCIHLHHAIIVNVMNNGQIIPFVYHLIICLQGTKLDIRAAAPRPDCNMSVCVRPARSSNTSPGHTGYWPCDVPTALGGESTFANFSLSLLVS